MRSVIKYWVLLTLFSIVNGIINTAEIFPNTSVSGFGVGPNPSAQYDHKKFNSVKELVGSKFWAKVVKKKDRTIAAKTVIEIQDTGSIYYFGDSELDDLSRSGWFGSSAVDLVEVQYGECNDIQVRDIPTSYCISSTLSTSGGSYTQTHVWAENFGVSFKTTLNVNMMIFGASLGVKWGGITLNYENSGSIKCTVASGKTVQVFASFHLKQFTGAKKRSVKLGNNVGSLRAQKWESLVKDQYRKYGMVFFSQQETPNYYCVDDENKLQCQNAIDTQVDHPTRILDFAEASRFIRH